MKHQAEFYGLMSHIFRSFVASVFLVATAQANFISGLARDSSRQNEARLEMNPVSAPVRGGASYCREWAILADCERYDGQKFGEVFGDAQADLKPACRTMDGYTSPVKYRKIWLPVICDCVRTDRSFFGSVVGMEFMDVAKKCTNNDSWTRPVNCRSF